MAEVRDATANMYLSDIRKRDIDNLTLVVKSAKDRHVFNKRKVPGFSHRSKGQNGSFRPMEINVSANQDKRHIQTVRC